MRSICLYTEVKIQDSGKPTISCILHSQQEIHSTLMFRIILEYKRADYKVMCRDMHAGTWWQQQLSLLYVTQDRVY